VASKSFDFHRKGERVSVKCNKCEAPESNYYSEEGRALYYAKGWSNKINDTRSDIDLRCKSCGNEEHTESVNMLFIGG